MRLKFNIIGKDRLKSFKSIFRMFAKHGNEVVLFFDESKFQFFKKFEI